MPNPGTSYTALANLSLPRKGRKADDPNDLVGPGEQVILTAEQAAPFLNRTPPVLVKTADTKGGAVLLRPRDLSGRLRQPPAQPPKGYDGPRRDPPGSSHILVMQEIPEGAEPQPGDENSGAVPAGESIVDAMDLPPSGHARTGALS